MRFRRVKFTFSPGVANAYDAYMALLRILVDGYSLLHNWPELAPDHPRHSERARQELIHVLTRYHDATGTPVTIFFDRRRAEAGNGSGGGGFVFARGADRGSDD